MDNTDKILRLHNLKPLIEILNNYYSSDSGSDDDLQKQIKDLIERVNSITPGYEIDQKILYIPKIAKSIYDENKKNIQINITANSMSDNTLQLVVEQ